MLLFPRNMRILHHVIVYPLLSLYNNTSQLSLQFQRIFLLSSLQNTLSSSLHPTQENNMATCFETPRRELSHDHPNRPETDENNFNFVTFCRPSFCNGQKCYTQILDHHVDDDYDVWLNMQEEAKSDVEKEPILSSYYHNLILSHATLASALANHLSIKLSNPSIPSGTLYEMFMGLLDDEIVIAVKKDLIAVKERDPACLSYVHCFLNYKGFLSCQAHRIAHKLWSKGRKVVALMIQNKVSEVFAVDIHPGAKIGHGVFFDHATGVVIGETSVIGNDVSILHNVTLGGTGKMSGDRHPKIGDGVLIGAGTCILGNIKIGDGAKIGAGSIVLKDVPPRTTAVGNPARLVGGKEPIKLYKIPSLTMDHTSHVSEWSDYVI